MVKLGSFSDGTSSRFKNKLKTNCLSKKEIKQKRVAVVKFRMIERDGYCTRCGTIDDLECDIGMIQTQQKYDQKKLDCYQR